MAEIWTLLPDLREQEEAAAAKIFRLLTQAELKRTTFQHVETRDQSLTLARITPPTPAENQALREELQQEAESLPPEAQPYFLVDVKRAIESFSRFPEPFKVVIRVVDTQSGGEQNWYYHFDTNAPEQFSLQASGTISLPPGHDPVMSRKPWSANDLNGPARFEHLFPLSD